MNKKQTLLVDIGGTNTRFAHLDEQTDKVTLIETCPTSKDIFWRSLDYYRQTHRDISVAVAGPVIDGRAEITFNDFSVSLAQLREIYQTAFLMNDYEAAAYGLPQLDTEDLLCISGNPNQSLTQLLVGIGTGFGVACRKEKNVLATEAGFSTIYPESQKAEQYLQWRSENGLSNNLHGILAGGSIADVLSYVNGKDVEWSPAMATEFFLGKNEDALDLWTELLGQGIRNMALTFLPYGGLFISGGVIYRYRQNIEWDIVHRIFKSHPDMNKVLERIPLTVLKKECVLEGCLEAISK